MYSSPRSKSASSCERANQALSTPARSSVSAISALLASVEVNRPRSACDDDSDSLSASSSDEHEVTPSPSNESLSHKLKPKYSDHHNESSLSSEEFPIHDLSSSLALADLPHNRIKRISGTDPCWQATKSCVKERISYLYNNDTLSDISFLVGRNKVKIPGHKFILAVGSPVFDAMFNGPLALKDSETTVELPDVEPEAFHALLKFLYSDEVNVSPETVLTVLYTAKKYAVPTLEEHCVAFLKDNLNPDNAFLLLSQARLFDEQQLAALCLDCIDKNTQIAMNADGFVDVDLNTLCAVLQRDTLRIKELSLFHAVFRWTAQECIRQDLEVNPLNQRQVLGRGLQFIRFPLIPVEDFAIHVAKTNLLSESELVQLFLNFNISSTNMHHKPKLQFSDHARCYMTGKQLSVYRFQQVETRWGYNGLSDQIRFTTDRRIYLTGVGLFGGLFGSKEYKVDIQINMSSQGSVLGHHSDAFTSDGSKKTFRIMFKEPVEILPDITYTASATLRGSDSHYGTKGQRKVAVECPDGSIVNFTFYYSSDNNNGTTVEDGQIPELIFHL